MTGPKTTKEQRVALRRMCDTQRTSFDPVLANPDFINLVLDDLEAAETDIIALKADISDAWKTGSIGGVPLNLSPADD